MIPPVDSNCQFCGTGLHSPKAAAQARRERGRGEGTRRACLILLALGLHLGAAEPGATKKGCAAANYEIAYVETSIGTFADQIYKRTLARNMPVCSDSQIVHVKDGKQTNEDELVLKGVLGEKFPAFRCKDLLNCKDPIRLSDIHAKLLEQLKGQPVNESLLDVRRRSKSGQTSTITRVGVFRDKSQSGAVDFKMYASIIRAGQDLDASVLFPDGIPAGVALSLDVCLNAEQNDCGATLPKPNLYEPRKLAPSFRKLPSGLHVVYEAKPPPGDTVPIRTGNTTFVLSAHPGWTPEMLTTVKLNWSALVSDPENTPDKLNGYLVMLGRELSQPPAPSSK